MRRVELSKVGISDSTDCFDSDTEQFEPLLYANSSEFMKDDLFEDTPEYAEWGSETGVEFIDRVACFATVRVTSINPKHGTFQVRMQCQWAFSTLNPKDDTEIVFRGVPGIRMAGLNVRVQESRIWKDLGSTQSASKTASAIFWRGSSIFIMDGFKVFDVKLFPFDRQVLNLQQLDFVWRSSKDDDDYFNSMKIAWVRIETFSMLSEWRTEPALVGALNPNTPISVDDLDGQYATKFRVQLHIERQHSFYVRQIFFVTLMITLASLSPLAMPPTEDHMGDRLSVYGSGLLTLVAFKYGIMEHLPSVPYSTFTDNYLLYQIITVTACTFESLFVFRWRQYEMIVDWLENCLLIVVASVWSVYLLWVAFKMPQNRLPWEQVRSSDHSQLPELKTPQLFRQAAGAGSDAASSPRRLRSKSFRHGITSADSNTIGFGELSTADFSPSPIPVCPQVLH
eukprot:TRINITY_DN112254_c0_g1_i1.p1 TRINITY_DN112254_c0_g1~~TRINITY_DN112254_c0_g1_i1.p1  ORF type:complete len:453 (-),score=35.10 TRINITY_DN112254_c0_g1_i1:154-1512(-)